MPKSRFGRSLQRKAWMVTAGVLFGLGGLLAVGVEAVFRQASGPLGNQWVAENVRRLQAAQTAELDALERGCRDYANWSETYAALGNARTSYVENNLLPSMFANLQLDAFLLFQRDGRLQLGRSYDGISATDTGIGELTSALSAIARRAAEAKGHPIRGLVRVGGQIAIVAVLPVFLDDGSGPPAGALAQVRFLNAARVFRLREMLNLDLGLHESTDIKRSQEHERASTQQPGAAFTRTAVSDRFMEVDIPLLDLRGRRIGYWHLQLEREIHLQGIHARFLFYVVIGVLIVAAALVIGWLFRTLVSSRLEALHAAVQRVGATSDLSVRVPLRGSDELTGLTDGINRMFEALAESDARRVAAEQERERLNSQLKEAQKLEAIGTLAGGLAHDFNNLITGIQGSATLIRLETAADDRIEQHLQRIEAAAKQAAGLVRQMMAFGRRSPTVFANVHLGAVVNDAFTLVRSSVPRGIEFKFRNEAVDDTVHADSSQLQQVLINLVTNSSHAMASGAGTVTVEIRAVRLPDPSRQETVMLPPGDYLRLIVSDDGCGIPAEHLTRVFEPFYTTKPVGSGTGLGLAVVHGIISSHRGSIAIESDVGRGTRVFIHLPTPPRTGRIPQETALPMSSAGAVSRRGHLLLVDDDALVRGTLEAGMRRMGYEVEAASSGANALRLFETQSTGFDAVITDQMMPGMTGIELGQRLAQLQPKLPLILMTGYAAALNEPKVKAMGFFAMLMKPVTMQELDETLQAALREMRDKT